MNQPPYRPGARSLLNLRGVHPELRRATDYAYVASTQDFSIVQGRRTVAQQTTVYANGNSRTLDSRHLTGHAIDFCPYNGGLDWKWPGFYPVVKAYHRAATDLGIVLRWGGVWDRNLAELDPERLEREHADYVHRFEAANPGKKALQDGGHIELLRAVYP